MTTAESASINKKKRSLHTALEVNGDIMSLNTSNENKKRCIVEKFPLTKNEEVTISSEEQSNDSSNIIPASDEDISSEKSLIPHPDNCSEDMDPDTYLKLIVKCINGESPTYKPTLSLSTTFFPSPTQEQITAYNNEVVAMVRENLLDDLRSSFGNGELTTLQCSNRFGESLMHMACRRGHTEMVSFLVKDANVSVRVRDDCGRTPLHDAAWNQKPQFEIFNTLIENDPILLFLTDKRGSTAFEYARREHWGLWRQFLYQRREMLCLDKVSKELCLP